MLSVEIQAEIMTQYFTEKRSVRSIARELEVSRRTVRRIVERRSIVQERVTGPRASIVDPFKDEIKRILDKEPNCAAKAIFDRARSLGYSGGITALQQYVRKVRQVPVKSREAFLRLTFEPGEAAQVDWGEFGDVFDDGIKIHCFAMVLCHSRYLHIEFTRSEKFEDFIRGHENAFLHFGGAPRECWYDNLASAVTERHGSLIRFNSRFMAYMGHHGIRPHACNVARGNEKGRVEGLIKYIRMNFWAGRTFKDFEDLVDQAFDWRDNIANKREHRSTHRIVKLHFENDEKAFLLKTNPNLYDTDEIFSKSVPPDFHIVHETNRYSVPWTLVGMTVTVRVSHVGMRFYYNEKQVASHARSYKKNQVFTIPDHQKGLLERKPGTSRETWQLAAVKNIGPLMLQYIDLIRSGHRSLRSELSRILALSTVYGDAAVHDACGALLKAGVVGVEALEVTLKRLHHPATSPLRPEPIAFANDKLNRVVPAVDLRRYDALLFEADIQTTEAASKGIELHGSSESNPERDGATCRAET